MKKHICLIGEDLSNSLSKKFYEYMYDCVCTNIECKSLPNLKELAQVFDGIAITSPFKFDAGKQLSKKRPINFVDNMCNAYLTDSDAFMDIVKPVIWNGSHSTKSRRIYVLGHGAMAEMVIRLLKADYKVIQISSRDPFEWEDECLGVINCSKAKKYFHIYIPNAQFYYDMNYNGGYDTEFTIWMKTLNQSAIVVTGYLQLAKQCELNMQIIGAEKK